MKKYRFHAKPRGLDVMVSIEGDAREFGGPDGGPVTIKVIEGDVVVGEIYDIEYWFREELREAESGP